MKTTDEKKAFLQALENVSKRRKDQRKMANIAAKDNSVNLAKGTLDKDILPVKSSGVEDLTQARTKVGTTDKLDLLGEKQNILNSAEHKKKLSDINMQRSLKLTAQKAAKEGDVDMLKKLKLLAGKMGKGATRGLKALPLVGGVVSALASGNASAAVPGLDSAESVGMSPQAEREFLSEIQARKDYEQSQAKKDKLAALAKLSKIQGN